MLAYLSVSFTPAPLEAGRQGLLGEVQAVKAENERAALLGGGQAHLQLMKGFVVQPKEFEHHPGGLKGPLKAIRWGLTLGEPDPEPGWTHEFLVFG